MLLLGQAFVNLNSQIFDCICLKDPLFIKFIFKIMSSCFFGEVKSTSSVLPTLRTILFAFNQFSKF